MDPGSQNSSSMMFTSWTAPVVTITVVGCWHVSREECEASRRPCAFETSPKETATGTDRRWWSPKRRRFDRVVSREDRFDEALWRFGSALGQNPGRFSSRALRWRALECCEKPCRG